MRSTCSRHGCVAARSLISSKSCRKKGQSPTSVTERLTRQRDRLCGSNWRGGRWECRRAFGAERERHLPSAQARVPHGGEGCSHLHAAQMHDGTVIKFLLIPSKEGIIISVNEPQADAAARRCWCPLQKKQHPITKLQGDVVFRRGITLGHPQPATDDPMNYSLASNVVSS